MLYYISSLYNVYITFCVGANVHISTNIDAKVNFFFFSSPYHEVLFETLTQADEKVERSLWWLVMLGAHLPDLRLRLRPAAKIVEKSVFAGSSAPTRQSLRLNFSFYVSAPSYRHVIKTPQHTTTSPLQPCTNDLDEAPENPGQRLHPRHAHGAKPKTWRHNSRTAGP